VYNQSTFKGAIRATTFTKIKYTIPLTPLPLFKSNSGTFRLLWGIWRKINLRVHKNVKKMMCVTNQQMKKRVSLGTAQYN